MNGRSIIRNLFTLAAVAMLLATLTSQVPAAAADPGSGTGTSGRARRSRAQTAHGPRWENLWRARSVW